MKTPTHEEIMDARTEAALEASLDNEETVADNATPETRGIWDERNKTWIRPGGTVKQGRRPMFKPFKTCRGLPPMNTEQRDTRKPILQALLDASESFADDDTSHLNQPEPDAVQAYWKSKEGKCLACGAEIAVEESYCGPCTEFLIEAHESRNPLA